MGPPEVSASECFGRPVFISKTVGRLLAGPISPIDVETMRCCGKRAFTAFRAGLATKLICARTLQGPYQRVGH